jgi:hypothetical protein
MKKHELKQLIQECYKEVLREGVIKRKDRDNDDRDNDDRDKKGKRRRPRRPVVHNIAAFQTRLRDPKIWEALYAELQSIHADPSVMNAFKLARNDVFMADENRKQDLYRSDSDVEIPKYTKPPKPPLSPDAGGLDALSDEEPDLGDDE